MNGSALSRKDSQVGSFDQLVEQYNPMIHKIIQSLNIYKNQEEFYQTGLIGLWEANKFFDASKGTFTNYAYTYIKGKLLTEMSNSNLLDERMLYPKEEYWETIEDQDASQPLEHEQLLSYCRSLTEKETKWVLATYLHDLSMKEIAKRENVTVSAVKQWKQGALKKIRGKMEAREQLL
jgi:RNA polymerase sigma factor (sigma-70 family)